MAIFSCDGCYVILYQLITKCVLDEKKSMGVWLLPWRWRVLPIPLETGRGIGAKTCGLEDVFPPDDLGSGLYTQRIIIYMSCIIAALYVIEISSA